MNVENGTAAVDASLPAPPPPKDFPPSPSNVIYSGLAGEFIEKVDLYTEADPVAIVFQFVIGFGNMAGRAVFKMMDGSFHYANLDGVIVGETAKARKGTSFAQAFRPLRLLDPDWANDRVTSGLSSGEGLIWAVRDPVEQEVTDKKTGATSMVVVDPGVDDKRVLVFESEFVAVLKVALRDGNTLSTTIRQAWETGNLSTMVKHSPNRATGAHVSIIAHVTRDELLRYFSATEAASGFGNRFIWFAARRQKLLPEADELQESAFNGLVMKMRRALDEARKPREMKFDKRARELWWSIYPELSRDRSGLMGAVLARAEAQVARLALVYALLDCAKEIRPEHLESALGLWHYSEASAKWIFGDALGDPDADTILNALRSQPNGLTRTDISNLFGRNLSAPRIDRALTVLLSAGKAAFNPEKIPGRAGRHAERWRAISEEA